MANKTSVEAGAIYRKIGQRLYKRVMAKHYRITVADETMHWKIRQENIKEESSDGLYLVRTSIQKSIMNAH